MSAAAPHFHFEVDTAYNKEHNEYYRDVRRLQLSAVGMALVYLAVIVGTWLSSLPVAAKYVVAVAFGAMALISLALIFVIPQRVGAPQANFDRYPLVPAIVAEVNPRDLVLLALVNASVAGEPEVPALCARTVTRLPGHERKVGEKVPAVAVAGVVRAGSETFAEVTPMPIAWGTPEEQVVRAARDQIPGKTWQELAKMQDQLPAVLATKRNLLLL